jgi:hypothetical protein
MQLYVALQLYGSLYSNLHQLLTINIINVSINLGTEGRYFEI